MVALKKAVCWGVRRGTNVSSARRLTAETVQSAALAFQRVDDVHSGDGLPLGVLSVGDGISDHVLQKYLEDTASLFVDQSRDTLDASAPGESTDSRLGDTLDVVTQNFTVTFGTSLSEPLSTFATSGHLFCISCWLSR